MPATPRTPQPPRPSSRPPSPAPSRAPGVERVAPTPAEPRTGRWRPAEPDRPWTGPYPV